MYLFYPEYNSVPSKLMSIRSTRDIFFIQGDGGWSRQLLILCNRPCSVAEWSQSDLGHRPQYSTRSLPWPTIPVQNMMPRLSPICLHIIHMLGHIHMHIQKSLKCHYCICLIHWHHLQLDPDTRHPMCKANNLPRTFTGLKWWRGQQVKYKEIEKIKINK